VENKPVYLPSPFYVVAQKDGVTTVLINGEDAALFYSTRELCELYIEQAGGDPLFCLEVPGESENEIFKPLLFEGVKYACLNPTIRPQTFVLLKISDLFGRSHS
jgi:hypothetical protein